MATVEVDVVRAFVEDAEHGGNPAGVVVDLADRLDRRARLAIAAKVGLSETAFVSPSRSCAFRLEFFTPTRQIPHCGHATVAAFGVLAARGLTRGSESSNETMDGPRRIVLDGARRIFMEQAAASFRTADAIGSSAEQVLGALGLGPSDLLRGLAPTVADNGNRTLLVPVQDQATLRRVSPDLPAIAGITERLGAVCFYVFALDPVRPGRAATARMFAPGYGIPEEAATGMAAGALASWLHETTGDRRETLLIEQGWFMPVPSPSVIEVRLEHAEGRIRSVLVGGAAAAAGRLLVDPEAALAAA